MIDKKSRFSFWLVFIVAAITLLPFCGNSDFTTKGEPREAVVAVSMLQQHNWILPVNNGVDIPYKPPFFQWCIATLSLPTSQVTPLTSRLPSAIALILMASAMAAFVARRKDSAVAIVAAGLTLTAFEVHRAGTNCRVDMVLTLFIVGALCLLYRWWERGCRRLPWLAILAMSGATLTKGPVGIALPCFVMGVFIIVMGWRDHTSKATVCLRLFGKLLPAALLACVLPSLWYAAAYRQGGDDFLWLVMDENVGRFLGKMEAVTHDNPWPYNILMLVSGWLPWTFLLLASLFVLPWRRFSRSAFVESARKADAIQVFTWLAFLLILFFYCIPKSKRGVYLLPCYPFMATLIAEYLVWLAKRSYAPVRIYIGLLTAAGFLVTALLITLRTGAVPDTIFHGRHAADNIAVLHALAYDPLSVSAIIYIMLPVAASIIGLLTLMRRRIGAVTERPVLSSIIVTLLLFMGIDGYYKPAIMQTKSLKPFACRIAAIAKDEPLYAYTGHAPRGGNALRFFGVDFYLNDRVRQFDRDLPARGLVMVPASFLPTLKAEYAVSAPTAPASPTSRTSRTSRASRAYTFTELYRSPGRETEFKDTIYVFRFVRPVR